MILLRSFSLKTARSPVPLLRRILLRIPPLLHPRMKRPFRSTSPTHPCRRLQRIPPHPEVLTDEEYLAPPAPAGPSPKINEHGVPDPALRPHHELSTDEEYPRPRLQPSVSGAGNGRRNFSLWPGLTNSSPICWRKPKRRTCGCGAVEAWSSSERALRRKKAY
jgi:hypothetical protein